MCDHSDLSRRLSALGAFRFWRGMCYAVGALVTGTCGNWSLAVKTLPGLWQETGQSCSRGKDLGNIAGVKHHSSALVTGKP